MDLKFDEKGLIPAIVQDHYTKEVLTLAYMNAETLALTIAEGRTVFWSRSRQEIWRKGETSGNVQRVVSITADCDADALVVEVVKSGPACHTGAESCFFNEVYVSPELKQFSWQGLYDLIKGRKTSPKEGSYTTYLFEKGKEKILKKVGEECTEVIIAGEKEDKAETVYEISDLAYHVLVLMVQAGITVEDITRELEKRHVIDHKVKQERMQGFTMADYKKSSVHCHSTMCDGKNTLQEMASAACAQGLTTLGFTGHSYTQRDREYCMSPSRTAQYKATIAKLKTEYKGKVDILCGIEWDLLSEDKRTGYDYWIGSAHHLYGKNTGKYYEIDFRPQDLHDCIYDDFDGDPLAAVEAYFAEVEKVAAMGPDILAHIDLIKKLNAAGEFFDEESPRYKAAALKALNAAKEHGCLLEVNTGGVYRGYRKDFYPGAWLLGEWQKMGGKVIITSDAHDVGSLTFGFDEAAAAVKAAGFKSVEVLTINGFETQEL